MLVQMFVNETNLSVNSVNCSLENSSLGKITEKKEFRQKVRD